MTRCGIRSLLHGRRRGKKLRPYQAGLLTDRLPHLAIAEGGAAIDTQTLFSRPISELWLEIGFGGGEHLVPTAQRRPECGFIGCEPFINGVAKVLSLITANDVTNIRLFVGDAAVLIDRLPDACLSRVHLFYPDPWPKRRHRERRFVSEEALMRLGRVMRPGSELRFVTDIDDYSGWVLARVLRSHSFVWRAGSARDWMQPWVDWTPTRYELKALREGRRPAYLIFTRQERLGEASGL
jgi:tRNA (guanine-N7-)-methyltransferase